MTGLIGLMVVMNMCPVLGSAFYHYTGLDEVRSIFDATVSMRVLNNITEKESAKATRVLYKYRAHFSDVYVKSFQNDMLGTNGSCSEVMAHDHARRACSADKKIKTTIDELREKVTKELIDRVKSACMDEFRRRNWCEPAAS